MKKKVEIIVSGKVQGVFFRASTREKARYLNLTGNVRNLTDGRVRIIASGEANRIDQLVQWCRKGPIMARVEDVLVTESEEETHADFVIIR